VLLVVRQFCTKLAQGNGSNMVKRQRHTINGSIVVIASFFIAADSYILTYLSTLCDGKVMTYNHLLYHIASSMSERTQFMNNNRQIYTINE